jgi:glyoxylase-like metal-dependent hydrolase (beta-lactamase superfamily II)
VLTLTFLGVGSAFAKRHYQSNALIEAWSIGPDRQESPDETLLIDFGNTGPLALYSLMQQPGFEYLCRGGAIYYPAIRNVIVTHLHADHVGGLEELATLNVHRFVEPASGNAFKPRLFSTKEILPDLWNCTLRGGLGVLHDRRATLNDYFVPTPIRASVAGDGEPVRLLDRYEICLVPTDHIRMKERYDWPSVGVCFRDSAHGHTALFTGDTRFDPPGLGALYEEATMIFHDVLLHDEPDPVHARLSDLRSLAESVRRKMLLYHFGDDWDEPSYESVAREFRGFAVPQTRYTVFPR